MSSTFNPSAVVWAPVPDGYWPAIVIRLDGLYCVVRLLGDQPLDNSQVYLLCSKLINYEQNLHHACVPNRKILHTACLVAQNAGLPDQRALFAMNPFKNFLSLLQSNQTKWTESRFVFHSLVEGASRELREAHRHLRATDAALRSKKVEAGDLKNRLLPVQLRKLASQCRLLAIEREENQVQISVKEVEEEINSLKLSRKAAFSHYLTFHPSSPTKTMAHDLKQAKNEAAHWKRQYEEVQKELLEDKKRRKTHISVKEEVDFTHQANGFDIKKWIAESGFENSNANLRLYIEAKHVLGTKMISKKYTDSNPTSRNRAKAFLADLVAFQEENGEPTPRQRRFNGSLVSSYKLLSIVCEHGGIKNVVLNGLMGKVTEEVGIPDCNYNSELKAYYVLKLFRYEHMLVHGVLLPKGAGEQIKSLVEKKSPIQYIAGKT